MMGAKTRILAIDDDETTRWLLKEALASKGYDVLTAESGEQGFAMAVESKPDLILLDMMMPVMNGYATLKKLKDKPATKGIPVIMVTAVGGDYDKKLASSQGVAAYVTKPIDFTSLLEEVKRHLPG
jgi:DNA-binding response OmpR family regulator